MWTAVQGGREMSGTLSLVGLGFVALVAGVGAYFGAYLREKAKNPATHEDIERIVEDLQRTTRATEAIKAQVSSGVWNRQREWEMKREVMFETAKGLAAINNALIGLDLSVKNRIPDDPEWIAENRRAGDAWDSSADAFEATVIRVAIVYGDAAYDTFCAFYEIARKCAGLLAQNRGTEVTKLFLDLERRHYAVINTLRRELGLETASQPAVSSATTAPTAPAPE